jgi:hypothetical protein
MLASGRHGSSAAVAVPSSPPAPCATSCAAHAQGAASTRGGVAGSGLPAQARIIPAHVIDASRDVQSNEHAKITLDVTFDLQRLVSATISAAIDDG